MIVLRKQHYNRELASDDRQKNELAVAKIRQFELFKQITKLKLNSLRFHFHEKDIKRGSYLYRQGDSINGVFCILSGEASLIKETWRMAPQDDHFDEPVSHNTSNRLESSTNRSHNRQNESRLS